MSSAVYRPIKIKSNWRYYCRGMYRKLHNWTHTQDAALKIELFHRRKEGVESCLVEEADKQTLKEPGMTSCEGNTTAVYILVGGACRNGERSCAEHKCLNWTGVCNPEGRVYVPPLGVSACTRAASGKTQCLDSMSMRLHRCECSAIPVGALIVLDIHT